MQRAIWGLGLASALLLGGCATSGGSKAQSAKAGQAAEMAEEAAPTDWKGSWHRLEADLRVGRYTSIPWGFSTASYWIEGPDGVVLIDTQFLPSAAEEALEIAEHVTGKPVVLAVVLHANPDKFNGTATYQARGIRVVTSEQVLGHIPGIHKKRTRAFYDRYKPDYPAALPQPESLGSEDTALEAGGLTLNVHLLGAGCSEDHVVVEWDGHLFAGDLLANGAHSWLEIGATDQWLTRIDELEALSASHIHPGRGPSGGPEILTAERAYLENVIRLVAEGEPSDAADDAGIDAAIKRVEAAYPDLKYPYFLRIGIPAEWRRQVSASSPFAAPNELE